jgi:hypothetical protein
MIGGVRVVGAVCHFGKMRFGDTSVAVQFLVKHLEREGNRRGTPGGGRETQGGGQ